MDGIGRSRNARSALVIGWPDVVDGSVPMDKEIFGFVAPVEDLCAVLMGRLTLLLGLGVESAFRRLEAR